MARVRLALSAKRKQKYQNGNIHRKLKVPTSERAGKLSNPRARAARACREKISKVYGNPRATAARAPCIDFLPVIGTVCVYTHTKFSM